MITRDNTYAVVTSFNPDERFAICVSTCARIFSRVYIVDDGSNLDNPVHSMQFPLNTEIIFSGQNLGIASALNKGIRLALQRNPEWIVTFDQDSIPCDDLLEYYNTVFSNEKDIGIIGINISPSNNNTRGLIHNLYKQTYTIATSGLLHNFEVFKTVGMYNEHLFIDDVDFDYVLRIKMYGYNIFRIENNLLNHRLGMKKRFLCVTSTNHGQKRRYYMARNHVYLTKKYFFRFPLWIMKKNLYFIYIILTMIIVDDHRIRKLASTCRGLFDGLRFDSMQSQHA